MNYSDIVEQMIRVQSIPDATVGDIKIRCVGAPVTEECTVQNNEYVCTVRQLLYIEFPVRLSIHTDVEPDAIDGKEPGLLPEPPQIPQLKPARSRRQRRPLLFVLMEALQNRLFPRRK
jgi:hypothetical protein